MGLIGQRESRRPIGLVETVSSPGKRVRAELAVETVWVGATVFPEAPVWRVWFDGCLAVDTSVIGVRTAEGPLGCAMRMTRVTRHRAVTGIGPARELRARFRGRDGRELEVALRVTDLSVFCAFRLPRKRKQMGDDRSILRFPEGSVTLGRPDENTPQVYFSPTGKTVAAWRHGWARHVVFFDRPGDLAERRFGALECLETLVVETGRQGCERLFLTVPFTKAALPAPVFGTALTPAYRAAFERMIGREGGDDDFWVMRGEPGVFAVAARRRGGVWRVGGVTADARTLTVRLEDLWLRMPEPLRALRYTVEILRDPISGEPGDRVEETFSAQAPDVRVSLDLASNGGFLLTFRPEA